MELHLFSFPVIFTFFLFVFILFRTCQRSNSSKLCPKFPPGPLKLPLIGNLHVLVASLPHHRLRDLAKKYGPMMHLQLGELSTIIVSSPEVAELFLKTYDLNFNQRPPSLLGSIASYNYEGVIFSPPGEYWRQLRKIYMLEVLSSRCVQSFQSIREDEALNLIRSVSANTKMVNLTKLFSCFIYGVTSRAAIGAKCDEHIRFTSIARELMILAGGFSIADVFPSVALFQVTSTIRAKFERMHQEADKLLEKIINAHSSNDEPGDLLHVLLHFQRREDLELPVTRNSVKAVIMDVFMAGVESSTTTLDWTMAELMRNPRIMAKAQEEVRQAFEGKQIITESDLHQLKYLKLVLKETLRFHPPGPLYSRVCIEKCKINGYVVPVGTNVIINAWAIGRDPEYWDEAESFYPERFEGSSINYKGADFGFIPFGSGRRICPGMSFSFSSMELPLAQLLYYFDWELPNGKKPENLDMSETFGLVTRRTKELNLIAIPRKPLPLGLVNN